MWKKAIFVELIAGLIAISLFIFHVTSLKDALLGSFVFTNVGYGIVSALLVRQQRRPGWYELGFWSRTVRLAAIILSGTLAATFIGFAILGLFMRTAIADLIRTNARTILVFNIIVASVWTTSTAGFNYLKESIERKIRENEELKLLQVRTELQALQAKLNPHFLFNTLNMMINHVRSDPNKVEAMILNLSDIYRKTLDFSEKETIPLREEMELVREYLEIEKARLGDRLAFSITADAPLDCVQVPPLILEPVVENAVLHGIQPKPAGGKVLIHISHKPPALIITVKDDGAGFQPEQAATGFGLRSIRERLKLHYRDKARLEIEAAEGGGTEVVMEIPDGL